ncbi:MAG TPA: NADH-ubiquinone oxidoreductase-F iron-sulfur binding region domain-containing protein [Candidatus Nanopelagicales bacterium]|nr:NADH-ubiquinone oxidoreductase-F iron-sulfur binding region domain-containing protein [Candidatus Nanopelagicales bacterium]
MSTTVYVPGDSAVRSIGADDVARAITEGAAARGLDITVVRNGSRGLLWCEPLVEVVTSRGRVGYGPVTDLDVASLLDAGCLDATTGATAEHPLSVGVVDEIPWLASQTRITFQRMGVIDPLDWDDWRAHGGLAGLQRTLTAGAVEVIDELVASGLRGRGGAGFPAGIKWRTVAGAEADQKFVLCNADEGDSGTFADRMLLEGDPFTLIEGMVIAALAVGATRGYVYSRSEYPAANDTFRRALEIAAEHGVIGGDVLGTGVPFELSLRVGAGAYICGEETAMIESLQGGRGMVRPKPPIPALEGMFGKPTLVNNAMTLATVPMIVADGGAAYSKAGYERSRGTQIFQLAGNVARGGVVEIPFGLSLRELVEGYGGGTRTGRPVRAVQVGGPLGAYLPADGMDVALDYESMIAINGMVGHGGIVVFDDTVDMAEQARFAMEFCAKESCGKCTPCRVGSTRGVEVIEKIQAGIDRSANLVLLDDLCELMTDGSLCAMGSLTPLPVRSALRHFGEDFQR